MHFPLLDSLAQSFAMAAGICFLSSAIALRFMRVRANARLAPGDRISWVMELALGKRIIANYRDLYPRGWSLIVLRISVISWTVFVVLAIFAKILDAAI